MGLEQLTVGMRLRVFTGFVLLGLLILSALSLYGLRDNMLEDRHEKTRSLVQALGGMLNGLEQQVQAGSLTREQAQSLARAMLRTSRYEEQEYFFALDRDLRYLVMPAAPEKEGESAEQVRDPEGKFLFQEIRKAALADPKGGFVDYFWPRPGNSKPLAKISYVAQFEAWGWIYGTGIYLDDVDVAFREQGLLLGGVVLLLLAAMAGISLVISRSILGQLGGEPAYAAQVVSRIAQGDLTQEVRTDPSNRTSLLHAMGQMQARLAEIFAQINGMAGQLSSSAEQVSTAARETSSASHEQAQSTSATAASIEQMTVSINEVSQIASQTESNSEATASQAEQGARLVGDAGDAMGRISTTVAASSGQIQLLMQKSVEIGGIANVIREIADQTNLLALNAAIEAARAGEQGRGFAVVADEVRKLAERTTQATREISDMIAAIQHETQSAVEAMETTMPQVHRGLELSETARRMLESIHSQATQSLARVKDVALATREQATAANDIARHVEHIASMSEETNATMKNNALAAEELEQLAVELGRLVAYFKVR